MSMRNPSLVLVIAIGTLVAALPVGAVCVDWSTGAPPAPYVNFNGPFFHDLQGGVMRDGFLLKGSVTWSGVYYSQDTYLFDVRDPDQPREVRHWVGAGGPLEFPTEYELEDVDGARCVVGVFGSGGYTRRLVTSSVEGNTDVFISSLRGKVSLWGDRAFQLIDEFGTQTGVACLDVSGPVAPVLLGQLAGNFPDLQALSASLVLVRTADGRLQIIDFSTPAAPVLRGSLATPFNNWLGFADGRVVVSTGTTTIGVDVGDPDAPTIAWSITGSARAMAIDGNLMALGFGGTGATLALFDIGSGLPVPRSGAFGNEPSTSYFLLLADRVLYTGGICAYDVTNVANPQWLGQAGVSSNSMVSSSTFALDGERLVTLYGLLWSHCRPTSGVPAAAVGAGPAAHPNPFNPITTISFTTAQDGPVQVAVFDARGRLVRELLDASLSAGPQAVVWDGRGDDGQIAAAGLYVARVRTGAGEASCKVMMAK